MTTDLLKAPKSVVAQTSSSPASALPGAGISIRQTWSYRRAFLIQIVTLNPIKCAGDEKVRVTLWLGAGTAFSLPSWPPMTLPPVRGRRRQHRGASTPDPRSSLLTAPPDYSPSGRRNYTSRPEGAGLIPAQGRKEIQLTFCRFESPNFRIFL